MSIAISYAKRIGKQQEKIQSKREGNGLHSEIDAGERI
jgi:hypothetical protein